MARTLMRPQWFQGLHVPVREGMQTNKERRVHIWEAYIPNGILEVNKAAADGKMDFHTACIAEACIAKHGPCPRCWDTQGVTGKIFFLQLSPEKWV